MKLVQSQLHLINLESWGVVTSLLHRSFLVARKFIISYAVKRLPEQGYKYFRYPEHNIRILLFGHYRIAYLVKSHDEIFILGIFHGALDIDKYLFNGDRK